MEFITFIQASIAPNASTLDGWTPEKVLYYILFLIVIVGFPSLFLHYEKRIKQMIDFTLKSDRERDELDREKDKEFRTTIDNMITEFHEERESNRVERERSFTEFVSTLNKIVYRLDNIERKLDGAIVNFNQK